MSGLRACRRGVGEAVPVPLTMAMWTAVELETLSQQYYQARAAGEPTILPDEEIAVVLEKFKDYGLQAQI